MGAPAPEGFSTICKRLKSARFPYTPVIARSEATWQSVFYLQSFYLSEKGTDCHVGLRPPRNDRGVTSVSAAGRLPADLHFSHFTFHTSLFTLHSQLFTLHSQLSTLNSSHSTLYTALQTFPPFPTSCDFSPFSLPTSCVSTAFALCKCYDVAMLMGRRRMAATVASSSALSQPFSRI